jgi:hypothetical protein
VVFARYEATWVKVVQIPILFECQCRLLPFEVVESIFRTASPLQHFDRFYDLSNKRGIVVLATMYRRMVSHILCPVLLITIGDRFLFWSSQQQ